jgi:phosphoribosylformylglycinamidine synthase PurS subunit
LVIRRHGFVARSPYNECIPMKAFVYVSLKRSVLDPQGKTIQGALHKMGYQGLQDVRQGKFFELTLDKGLDRSEAESEIGRIAREVLTNPVIEDFRYSIEE